MAIPIPSPSKSSSPLSPASFAVDILHGHSQRAAMQIPPLEVLNAWPTPNYENPVTRGNAKIILNVVLYTFLVCFLSLRVYTRKCLAGQFGSDDVFILLALLPTTAFFIISILADTKFLWIRHQYDIPADNVVTGLKMVLTAEIMFALACTLTKISMLMLTRRMLENASVLWRRITMLAIVIVTMQGSIFCLTTIFQCRPPQDYWKITWDPQPNCINQSSSLLVAGIINTLTDFIVCMLPIRTVWSLHLPIRQIIPIIMLFAFGFVSCLAGIIRTYYTYEVTQTYDQVWYSYPVWITCAIELYVGVICASIPATKPFFSVYLPNIFGTVSPMSSKGSASRGLTTKTGVTTCADSIYEEELVSLEKALQGGRGFSNSANASRESCRRESGMDDCIRITQTVELSSGKATEMV